MRIYGSAYSTVKKSMHTILILSACLLAACSVVNRYGRYAGITYIKPVGQPPAETLVWSPRDSDKILITASAVGYGHAQVSILEVATTKETLLAETDYGGIWGTAWSPDGRYITLLVAGGSQGYEHSGLWIVNTEDVSMEFFDDKPGYTVWSPDGKTLAMMAVDLASDVNPRQVSLSLMNIQTRAKEVIYTNKEAINFSGLSWSPDGRYLVFSLSFEGTDDLYIVDISSRQAVQLTRDGGGTFPQWSPKGDLIAYQRNYNKGNKLIRSLHLVYSNGSCDIEIPNLDYVLSPTWSPDGRELALIGPDGIYILHLEEFFGRDTYQNLCN